MGNLMAGSVFVAVYSNDLDAEALQRDDDLLAEFAGAQQHDAQRSRGKRGADFHANLFGWPFRRNRLRLLGLLGGWRSSPGSRLRRWRADALRWWSVIADNGLDGTNLDHRTLVAGSDEGDGAKQHFNSPGQCLTWADKPDCLSVTMR